MIVAPYYLIDEKALENNAKKCAAISQMTGAKVLLALKAFCLPAVFETLKPYLSGVCASSVHEARLGAEFFGKTVFSYAPAFSEADFLAILESSTHISFNSFSQVKQFDSYIHKNRKSHQFGIRINPEYSEVKTDLYNPCKKHSRLGVRASDFDMGSFKQLDGLHLHALCGGDLAQLKRLLEHVELQFARALYQAKWLNLGGGHMLCEPHYDVVELCDVLLAFKNKYDLELILEPGEGLVVAAGALVSTVLDIVENDGSIAILDVSATAHMPDILEMPYRAPIKGGAKAGEKEYTYTLAGPTCLSGDVMGTYSFDYPLCVGSQVVFEEMAAYTFVKSTQFNGIKHPSLVVKRVNGNLELIKRFDYSDFLGALHQDEIFIKF